MTAFQSLFVGVAGLFAQSNVLSVVSDNISNANTVGYKKTSALFQHLVASEGAATFSPGGVLAGSRHANRAQGGIFVTGSLTDVAISGNGFFAVRQNAPDATGDIAYTRSGSFLPDKNGDFINGAGFFLQGWLLEDEAVPAGLTGGNIPAGTGLGSLETINIGVLNDTSIATTLVNFHGNLQASQAIYAGSPAYDATNIAANMADGAVPVAFSSPITVVDSTGEEHTLTVGFLKITPDSWAVEIYAPTAAEIGSTSAQVANGILTFNGDGTLASVGAGLATASVTWTDPAGATNTITFDWGTAGPLGTGLADGFSQIDAIFRGSVVQNGFPAGSLASINFTDDGFVVGNYNNGVSRRLYKIPLATFTEPNQLQSLTGNAFIPSLLSGTLFFSGPNEGASGKLVAGSLENSNVEMDQQMVDMLIAQRAYQANSKTIVTNDEMLDRLNRMLGS